MIKLMGEIGQTAIQAVKRTTRMSDLFIVSLLPTLSPLGRL